MRAAIGIALALGLWVSGCGTCNVHVRQRESQAGAMRDVAEEEVGDQETDTRETDLQVEVPLELP